MKIPFFDVKQQYEVTQEEAVAALAEVMTIASFVGGPSAENLT